MMKPRIITLNIMATRSLRSSTIENGKKIVEPKKKIPKATPTKKMTTSTKQLSDITLKDDSGKSYNIKKDIIDAGKPTLIFAYPKASTPGCTKQAQGFRDFYKKLIDEEGISSEKFQIFGLSNDTVNAQLKFKEKHGFQFPLLSDPERELISFLKADKNKKTGTIRSHWVWDKSGELVYSHVEVSPTVSLEKGQEELLELIKK
ncbi:Peroxiredoxin HuDOT5 [Hanseniaspora uvarum DSM 2768]|nr:Peroxiredoxin HuDOT5 [Hanseniaspora uvarum DSM 2768]